jgi:HAMP domain-containing protein
LAAFTLVIAATMIVDFSVHRAWMGVLLAFVVALFISGIAAQSVARRLNRIVQFADRVAAGDLAARLEEPSGSARSPLRSTRLPVTWKKALPRCRPASVSSKPC